MNMANLNPKRTKRCNQSSLVGTLKGTTPRHRPSRYAAFGKNSKRTTPRHRPSRYAAFGNRFKRTTPRHRLSRYAAFGKRFKRTTPRHGEGGRETGGGAGTTPRSWSSFCWQLLLTGTAGRQYQLPPFLAQLLLAAAADRQCWQAVSTNPPLRIRTEKNKKTYIRNA